MDITTEIAPNLSLAPFVRCYTHREFITIGQAIIKPWHACHEPSLIFFFDDIPVDMVTQTGRIIHGIPFAAIGIVTKYMGNMIMKGNYSFLCVQFRPNGFRKIFRLSSQEFTDNIISGFDFVTNQL